MKTYKALTIIALLIFLISCSKESSSCTDIKDGVSFEFKEGDIICINDYYIIISEVIDARCPACDEHDCFWEGEFFFKLDIVNESDETIKYTHHSESLKTPPEPTPNGFMFSEVVIKSIETCDDPVPIPNMIFEMTIN